ncbi:hypothetical protein PHMEG_00027656 [Phytophthora megakarya]|uniref:Reverse transcriptase n=1 Tax=Phytophthora megakarya TaxID=4795 RepID=A0A225V6F4_9STRA|nr:hypothetical protein PHMEG_00027656 [Phytophthora megakarya]
MSEVFQSFTEMMLSRSRATLSYQPQANDQQERSVKTVMQSVRVHAEDPLQQDWDEIAEKLIFENNLMDSTRKETHFSSSTDGTHRTHREMNRQQEIVLEMAKEHQATEKLGDNETLRGRERGMTPETGQIVTQSDGRPATGAVTEDSDG